MVSDSLIGLYERMNRPPVANAGGDRLVEHTASGVILDGSASSDPGGDELSYVWRGTSRELEGRGAPWGAEGQGASWEMEGRVATARLEPGTYEITLTVRDPSGHIDRDTFELTVVEDLDGELRAGTPSVGAYPNPFNNSTHIFFELAGQQRVSLQIFNLQGQLVRTLEEGIVGRGRHERFWDGTNNAGQTVSSGAYFVRMRARDRSEFSKILLLK